MKPLISILCSAYNHQRYIAELIDSCIAQTYPRIELIIYDDGSTDDTYQVMMDRLAEATGKLEHVIFLSKENEGTCKTLNSLIDKSQGEYIFFTASDDVLEPETIDKLHAALDGDLSYALAVGQCRIIDSQSRICFWNKGRHIVYKENEAKYRSFSEYLERKSGVDFCSQEFGTYRALLRNNHIPNGFLVRKSIFGKIGLFTRAAPLEDYWLVLQISKNAKMRFVRDYTYRYRWHSADTRKRRHSIRDQGYVTMAYEWSLLQAEGNKEHIQAFEDIVVKHKSILRIYDLLELFIYDRRYAKKLMLKIGSRYFCLRSLRDISASQ